MDKKYLIWIISITLIVGLFLGYCYGYFRGLDEQKLTIPQAFYFCRTHNLTMCSFDTNTNEITCGNGGCFRDINELFVYDNPTLRIKEIVGDLING